jgi:hypothetical protein
MRNRTSHYSTDDNSQEDLNVDDKYAITGESSFTRDITIPFDHNDALSERSYRNLSQMDRTRRNFSGRGPKGYKRSDERILEDVSEALFMSPDVDPSYIEVFVEDGVVTLKGTVERRSFKKAAEFVVEKVSGVKDVFNEVRVDRDTGGLVQNRTSMS